MESSPAPSRPFLLALVLAMALGPISVQMFLPALPSIQRAFGVDAGHAHLALSLAMVAIAVSTLLYGPLSDRLGRRPVLIAGQLLFIAGSALCWHAASLGLLVAGRVVQAAGASAGLVLARAIVRDTVPAHRIASVLAYFTMAMAFFPMFTPAIGGMLIDALDWRAVFVFSVGVGLVSLLAVVARVRETRPDDAGDVAVGTLSGLSRTAREPVFWSYALCGGFGSAAFFGFISAVPALMRDGMGRPATEYGIWFVTLALSFMAGNLLAARASARVGRDRMIVAGALVIVTGAGGLFALYAAGYWHPLALFGPGMLVTFGQGAAGPNTQAGAVSGDAVLAGTASGLYGFIQTLMAAISAQAMGSLQDGTPIPMAAFALLGGAGSLLSMAGASRLRRRGPLGLADRRRA
jgi:DHA1 family bicyclomycin/chloramphenicol resistance-like MFS transporter